MVRRLEGRSRMRRESHQMNPKIGINVRVFPALLQDRREVTGVVANRVRVAVEELILGISEHREWVSSTDAQARMWQALTQQNDTIRRSAADDLVAGSLHAIEPESANEVEE